MRTRGASSCVRRTPTGFPDWTRSVSSGSRRFKQRTIPSNAAHDRAAWPRPPYTTSRAGSSATSGSRLFISMRSAASASQVLQVRVGPWGARTVRGGAAPPGRSSFGLMALPTNVSASCAEATAGDELLEGVDVGRGGPIGDALRDRAADFRVGAFHPFSGPERALVLE